jgi:tripartite-type tricarboxylate transporter receptor subunit TctC
MTTKRPFERVKTYVLPCAAALCMFSAAHAQDFPSKPIRIVVGFAPGGSNDIVARLVAPKLGELLKTQVVVENRPGANAIIGTDAVAKSAPDGYTLGLVGVSNLILNPLLYPKVPYHAINDFTGLTTVGVTHQVISVHPSLPAKNLKELIALAKARPGQLNFGSPGAGGLKHLTLELLNTLANVRMQHVAYKGGGPALTDALGGQTHGVIVDIAAPYPHIKQGKLRALAVTGESRAKLLPDVPTVAEQGIRMVSLNWFAIVAPAKTPQPIIDRLYGGLLRAAHAPEVKERFDAIAVEPLTHASPAAFQGFVREEYARWGKVVKDSNVASQL